MVVSPLLPQDPWSELVPRVASGEHKSVREFVFNKKSGFHAPVTAGFLLVTLYGRTDPNYHTSLYWLEVMGKPSA